MDFSDLYQVLSESFLSFLAVGCGVSRLEMDTVFAAERKGDHTLVPFLKQRFEMSRFWDQEESQNLRDCLDLIEKTP
jgi:hypothetical protein